MELLTIGAFARASRLSPKALRLYDSLGLLKPAHVDEVSGYRFYRPDQLERARLVAWLRRLGMPLARIQAVCDLAADAPDQAAGQVAAYWAETEAEVASRRDLASYLISYLSGEDTAVPEMQPKVGVDLGELQLGAADEPEGAVGRDVAPDDAQVTVGPIAAHEGAAEIEALIAAPDRGRFLANGSRQLSRRESTPSRTGDALPAPAAAGSMTAWTTYSRR